MKHLHSETSASEVSIAKNKVVEHPATSSNIRVALAAKRKKKYKKMGSVEQAGEANASGKYEVA
jgi:hypothetical protein